MLTLSSQNLMFFIAAKVLHANLQCLLPFLETDIWGCVRTETKNVSTVKPNFMPQGAMRIVSSFRRRIRKNGLISCLLNCFRRITSDKDIGSVLVRIIYCLYHFVSLNLNVEFTFKDWDWWDCKHIVPWCSVQSDTNHETCSIFQVKFHTAVPSQAFADQNVSATSLKIRLQSHKREPNYRLSITVHTSGVSETISRSVNQIERGNILASRDFTHRWINGYETQLHFRSRKLFLLPHMFSHW